jgi:aspartate carbamoyltransferase
MSEDRQGLLLDVLSADQFTAKHIKMINDRAYQFQRNVELARGKQALKKLSIVHELEQMTPEELATVISQEVIGLAADILMEQNYRRLGSLAAYFWFDEHSINTVGSFDAARTLLGMEKLGHTNAKLASSTAIDESLRDSMRTANEQLKPFGGGVVIIRHPDLGSAAEAADIMDFPVINAGDGQNEHPTQALLDIYTIKQRHGRLDDLHVVMGGDPRYTRTIHSLAMLLSLNKDITITFIGEEDDWLAGSHTKEVLDASGVAYAATTEMDPLAEADVVYWTRQQTERLLSKRSPTDRTARAYAKKFTITDKILRAIPARASIMHPLPRGPELPEAIDRDPRAAYWDQVRNGVPVRAALLEMILRNYNVVRTSGG